MREQAELALRTSEEERLQTLLRSVSDVIAILEADGTIRYVSPAAVVMEDTEGAVAKLDLLRNQGVQLAIDDIDRDQYNTAIVRSVVALAAALGIRLTAVGIETPAELAHLQALGCYGGQGFLFGRPVPAEVFETLLSAEGDVALAA